MSTSGPIKLLQITDTHLLSDRHALLRGVPTFATLQAVQRHAQLHHADAQGILLTGDLVQDDAAAYSLIDEAFSDYTVPVYCISGNHDVPDAMCSVLNKPPFVLADHALLGNWLIVLLNTWQAGSAAGSLGNAQLQRLQQLLNLHADRHALIALHHHPIKMHSDWLDQVGLQDTDDFHHCITRHANIRGVLWGHVHQALDHQQDGIRYMATPATCVQFLPGSHDFAVESRPPGYRPLVLHADGRIDSEVIWLE